MMAEALEIRLAQLLVRVRRHDRGVQPDVLVVGWSVDNGDEQALGAYCRGLARGAHQHGDPDGHHDDHQHAHR